jgi:hypothetical protein
MKQRIGAVLILLSTTLSSFGQDRGWQTFISPYDEFAIAHNQAEEAEAAPSAGAGQVKSIKKALLMSAVLPGSGEIYAGSYLKGAAFLALEAAGWTAWAVYRGKGQDLEDEFHVYADTYWSEEDYWDWIYHHAAKDPEFTGAGRGDIESLRDWEHDNFSHGLHRQKDQQYYEMIGKYDQFQYGWDDFDKDLIDKNVKEMKSLRTDRRLDYEEKRDDSNRAFKTATTGMTLVLLNHIASALDAAFTVRRYNNRIVTASFNVEPKRIDTSLYSCVTLQLKW